MKKLFLTAIIILTTLAAFSQGNDYKYVINAKGGLMLGEYKAAGEIGKLDSATIADNILKIWHSGVDLMAAYALDTDVTPKADIANETHTGTTTITHLQVGNAASNTILELDSLTSDGTSYSLYDGATQLAPAIPAAASDDLDDITTILTDVFPFYDVNIGAGEAGDTVLFSVGDVPWSGRWSGGLNFVIDSVAAIAVGSSIDVDITLYYNDTPVVSGGTEILSGDLTVTEAESSTVSFADDTIIPGQYILVEIAEAAAQPTKMILTIIGHLERQ